MPNNTMPSSQPVAPIRNETQSVTGFAPSDVQKFGFTEDLETLILASFMQFPGDFQPYAQLLKPTFGNGLYAYFTAKCLGEYFGSQGRLPTFAALADLVEVAGQEASEADGAIARLYVGFLEWLRISDPHLIRRKLVSFIKRDRQDLTEMIQRASSASRG